MVAPPASGGVTTTTTFPPPLPSTGSFQVNLNPPVSNGIFTNYPPHIPLSQRRAPLLDLATVERRGQPSAVRDAQRRTRPHGLQEAPTFRPTEEEFRDPMEYIRKIRSEGEKYGVCKIIPPDSWDPSFAINTERFFFKTRRQELNSVEGGTRTNINYLDQLAKFHKQHGMNLNRFPSVDKRPLDLYKLKKAVAQRGGFEKVCKLKKWAEIGRDLGYSGKIMSSLSTSLKNSYQRWLHPYEEYLKLAKPGVQQQLEFEHGGPFTPTSFQQAMKDSRQGGTPIGIPPGMNDNSPAMKASVALNASLKEADDPPKNYLPPPPAEPPRSVTSSGFTPVNAGGWNPVNLTPASYQGTTAPAPLLKRESDSAPPGWPSQMHSTGPALPVKDLPDYLNAAPLTNGHTPHASNPLKRTISHDDVNGLSGTDSTVGAEGDDANERRSKRPKKAPTVAGSHMSLLRPAMPKLASDRRIGKPGEACQVCGTKDDRSQFLVCDGCDYGYHKNCLDPPAKINPLHDWHCPRCLVGTNDFGFEEGGVYSLRQFQEKARHFKESYFESKMQFDPVANAKKAVTEDDVEREFWRLVESPSEEVEVEYGADIHSTTHGSGFPTIEKNPLDPYSTDLWNLNNLPLHPESLFRNIKSDISGMTVPWLYVGMCFSTFCWHNEDHYGYSANYQHFGATKTWYGIPGADAERFEEAMQQAVPELFESQPDLLFQLVTLLPPDRLKKAGVNVYALDQRAGQFVITFPQAYHAGFNHGFNFNEAVNFAPEDWEPFGEAGVERLQAFRKSPCFSHDELLMTAASRDSSIKTAKWLAPALIRLRDRELQERSDLIQRHKQSLSDNHQCTLEGASHPDESCLLKLVVDDSDVPEAESQCHYCKAYSYLSAFKCESTSKVMCSLHAGTHDCCEATEGQRLAGSGHILRYRLSDEALNAVVQKVVDRAYMPEAWQEKLDKALDDEAKPSLKVLKSLVTEGEKIPWDLPGLPDLKDYVTKCYEWVEEATNYTTRKQQNRRKDNRKSGRGSLAKAAEMEERDRELRKIENIHKLLEQAEELSFDCTEIDLLTQRSQDIAEFQQKVQSALKGSGQRSTQDLVELAESAKSFNVDVPEVEELEKIIQKMKWADEAREGRKKLQTLDDVATVIRKGKEINIAEDNEILLMYQDLHTGGELWESKAKELMSVEPIHHPQLEALASQADALPITSKTRAAVEAILAKQREAQKMILSLSNKSRDEDFRKRPKYKEVRDILEGLSELNSKPNGTIDLENMTKRHENWMRKGKKLFGKTNAPLHILQAHMNYVADHNSYCFDLEDKPRMPVEPATRENSPNEGEQDVEGTKSEKNVFCMCRQQEAGMMLECELCHEWYHGKCLKIARGKVKEDDNYTCPICDYRVKIPRDAARPKLEDLSEWQAEIPTLPFQPEEEEILNRIISTAQAFRDFMRPHINPVMTNPEEVTSQRFYLRKIEGAEILLSFETNFFRQELHKWAPVAPNPPPVLEQSLSTRKPRPTKQQKLMAQHNVNSPDDLPLQFRCKPYNVNKARKGSDPQLKNQHALAPAGRPRSSQSTSTTTSSDPYPPSRRLPSSSTVQTDPSYSAHYPLPASHNPHQQPESPAFAQSPYYSNGRNPHSPFVESPRYGPRSPMTHGPGGVDPNFFDNPFDTGHPHDHVMGSPHHGYPNNHSHMRDTVDNMFDEFVTQPEEDMNHRNEVAEALEERGRENDENDDDGRDVLNDFVHEPYQKS
ncbi:hypothetical protein ACLMJK_001285 [Lecanora helva]